MQASNKESDLGERSVMHPHNTADWLRITGAGAAGSDKWYKAGIQCYAQ